MPAQAVDRFVLGHTEWGEVQLLAAVDVRGLDLDAVVEMDKGRIQLYGLAAGPPAPAKGQGLNMPAMLTFRSALIDCTCCWL